MCSYRLWPVFGLNTTPWFDARHPLFSDCRCQLKAIFYGCTHYAFYCLFLYLISRQLVLGCTEGTLCLTVIPISHFKNSNSISLVASVPVKQMERSLQVQGEFKNLHFSVSMPCTKVVCYRPISNLPEWLSLREINTSFVTVVPFDDSVLHHSVVKTSCFIGEFELEKHFNSLMITQTYIHWPLDYTYPVFTHLFHQLHWPYRHIL